MANQFMVFGSGLAAVASGSSCGPDSYQGTKTFHGLYSGSGVIGGNATYQVQVSNHPSPALDGHWCVLGTITLSGTTAISDGFASEAPWRNYRYNVTAMSGISAIGTIWIGTNSY